MQLLADCGLDIDVGADQLVARCNNFDLDVLFLRDDDIPEYVQDGVCDVGIVGENVVMERRAYVDAVQRLGFGKCKLALAVMEGSAFRAAKDFEGKRIATSYPNLLGDFLTREQVQATIVEISGSAEIAPSLDLADGICDLVSSGNTLRRNGLRELQTVMESEAVLLQGRQVLSANKRGLVERLLVRVRGVLTARRTKYIAMNAPGSAVAEIRRTIPGLESPTVIPLLTPGMVAIHSVVDEEVFWEVMEKLKALGASGILVLPIEKIIK